MNSIFKNNQNFYFIWQLSAKKQLNQQISSALMFRFLSQNTPMGILLIIKGALEKKFYFISPFFHLNRKGVSKNEELS